MATTTNDPRINLFRSLVNFAQNPLSPGGSKVTGAEMKLALKPVAADRNGRSPEAGMHIVEVRDTFEQSSLSPVAALRLKLFLSGHGPSSPEYYLGSIPDQLIKAGIINFVNDTQNQKVQLITLNVAETRAKLLAIRDSIDPLQTGKPTPYFSEEGNQLKLVGFFDVELRKGTYQTER